MNTRTSPTQPLVSCDHATRVNFASAQNAVPVIRRLTVQNLTEETLGKLTLRFTAHPPFCQEKVWSIDHLGAGETVAISDRSLIFDHAFLGGLNEKEVGQFKLTLAQSGQTLVQTTHPVACLARDTWGGLADMAQILAAFVSPNHSAISKITLAAADILERHGHVRALDGYLSDDPRRAYMLAAAIWSSVTGLGLTYAVPPASFERSGQKIRDPGRIVGESLATCLDTTLLFCAALEASGLNPIAVFTQGHAFAGVWLKAKTLPNIVEPDITELRKAIAARELVVFETTLVTSRPAAGFEAAISKAEDALSEINEVAFEQAVDIRRARDASITPLASHESIAAQDQATSAPVAAVPLPPPRDFGRLPGDLADEKEPAGPEGRIQRWQRKLLDLSLRNRLLNFANSKQTLPLLCPDVSGLEDLLATGESLRVISLADENPVGNRDPELFRRQTGRDIQTDFAADALARKQACVPLAGKDMAARLTNLYRKAQSDIAEGGTNTLFLAAGFLKWKKDAADKRIYRAPLLLLPVTLKRRSARSDFLLAGCEDEPRFNATLLQFLKRDFELTIPGLDEDLPKDGSGIDLPRIFALVRHAVRDVPGFEVVEECALSTFSFAKYLMWKDLTERIEQLRNNRLVRHLIDSPDEPFPGACDGMPCPRDIDQRHEPSDLLTPLPADSSQLSAVVAAAAGKDFVVIGPPGTGKSQTIANMIAHCLAKGKSVLFVAEKSAALDVVHRRLKAHGLGDVCLELHSNKADRKRVIEQLGAAWDRAAAANEREWVTITRELKLHRDQLNAYVNALHQPGTHGVSIFRAIGLVIGTEPTFTLTFAHPACHDEEALRSLLNTAADAGRAHRHIHGRECFAAIECRDWSYAWQNELVLRAEALLAMLPPLRQLHRTVSTAFGLRADDAVDRAALARLIAFSAALHKTAAGDFSSALDPDFDQSVAGVGPLEAALVSLNTQRPRLSIPFTDKEIALIPIVDLERDWREALVKFWPLSSLAKSRVRKLLGSYASTNRKTDPANDLPLLRHMQENLAAVAASPCADIPGFAGVNTAANALKLWVAAAAELRNTAKRIRLDVEDPSTFEAAIRSVLAPGADELPLDRHLTEIACAHEKFASALGAYQTHVEGHLDWGDLEALASTLTVTLAHRNRIVDWTKWVTIRASANAQGLAPLIAALESGFVTDNEAENATRIAYFTWWLPLALDASPELRAFVHWDQTDRIDKFRALDEATQQLTSAQVRHRLSHQLPARDAVSRRSELGALRHQLGLQRPSLAIRQLIEGMAGTFNKLTPCVLMSPLSVAQYLPAKHPQFDLVIFDEASQITTWDAVGAIARGTQSIIVGDPKQLPPTNFFGRADTDEGNDGDNLALYEKDLPSILEECVTAGLPAHQLNWHYRSRDEALIAFSNNHYYSGRLVTFPSPKTASEAVVFHKIDGVYARGSGRTNEAEARAIVALACQRMQAWLELPEKDRLTLGVITFNVQQQELILDLFDAERRASPELEWFWSEDREEPTLVKNLENIQGDERDVMLFSITFGPDQSGALTMNFGALNNEGGEKRLNVAVTRARAELHIYASLTAEKIDLTRTNAIGVSHLKTFLDYAERGAIALPAADRGSLGPTESPFEDAVVRSLEAMGWQVRPQIGVSLFRIDIGVVHPDHAGAYLAGVECDGASYHSSSSARDRDKIREAVLRGLGWEIVRIWSTDWFMNPMAASQRVDQALRDLLAADRARRAASSGR